MKLSIANLYSSMQIDLSFIKLLIFDEVDRMLVTPVACKLTVATRARQFFCCCGTLFSLFFVRATRLGIQERNHYH